MAVFVLSRGKISTLGDTVGYSGQTELREILHEVLVGCLPDFPMVVSLLKSGG